jgi:isoamylase
MTLNYFAPDRRYAFDKSPGGPTRELQAMVRAFHDHGIKVFVDVVYNHTGEGGAWGATRARTT